MSFQIRQIIGNDASLSVALVDVVTRNIFSGSIVVEMALIFRENSSNNSSNITLASVVAATTTDANILQESGTAFTIVWNASAVQGTNWSTNLFEYHLHSSFYIKSTLDLCICRPKLLHYLEIRDKDTIEYDTNGGKRLLREQSWESFDDNNV